MANACGVRDSSAYRCSNGPSDHIDSGADSLTNYSANRYGANRHWDSVEDSPVAQQSLLPTAQTVQKTEEIPQIRHIDKVVGVPVVDQLQTPTIHTEQKTTDVPQIQCFEPLVDVHVVTQQTAEIPVVMLKQVPVMMRRRIPLVQKIQKMVEVRQIQFIDKVVDALVSMQREVQVQEQSDGSHGVTTGVSMNTPVAKAPHRKRKGSDIFLSPRLKAGMKERAQDDDHAHETLCASIVSAVEIAPVHFSLCDGTELESRPKGEHEGATVRQVDDILLEMKDVKSELLHVRELIGVLVRKERCAQTRAEIAASRLDRLEREQDEDEQDDKESETNLQEALSDKTKAVKVIDKWFVDKGFGFGKVSTGETVFIHASVVHGGEVLMVGGASRERRSSCRGRVSSTKRLGTKRLEGGEGQGKGEQSGSASETRSGAHS